MRWSAGESIGSGVSGTPRSNGPKTCVAGNFDPGNRAQLRIAELTADARLEGDDRWPRALAIVLGLQMRNPEGAIDRANTNCAVAPSENLTGRTFEALLFMRPKQEAILSEQMN